MLKRAFLAVDLRVLQKELLSGIKTIVAEELASHFSELKADQHANLSGKLFRIMHQAFDKHTVMDSADQMKAVANSIMPAFVEFIGKEKAAGSLTADVSLDTLAQLSSQIADKATVLHHVLRSEFFSGSRGASPAAPHLGRTKAIYTFIREKLGVRMHGGENFRQFENGLGVDDVSIGQNISKIYEVCVASPSYTHVSLTILSIRL